MRRGVHPADNISLTVFFLFSICGHGDETRRCCKMSINSQTSGLACCCCLCFARITNMSNPLTVPSSSSVVLSFFFFHRKQWLACMSILFFTLSPSTLCQPPLLCYLLSLSSSYCPFLLSFLTTIYPLPSLPGGWMIMSDVQWLLSCQGRLWGRAHSF